ncbi:MAG TPA: hypothetical protein VFR37_08505 [Longimicrobium sp.]|nr:hypothetical protein [Longimicrobium sp.]
MVIDWIVAAGNGVSEFGFHFFVSDRPHVSVETFVAPADRLYLVVYAGSHWGIALRDPVRAMEAIDARMPSWVWTRLRDAVATYAEVWDPHRAIHIERNEDWPFDPGLWGGEEDEDDVGGWRPSRITPKSLQRKRVSDRTVREALKELRLPAGSWGAQVMDAAFDLATWARASGDNGYADLSPLEKGAFDMVVHARPSIVAWIEPQGDGIMHAWDYYGEDFYEMDEDHFGPASCWPFNPSDSLSLLRLRERVRNFCGLMQRAGKLFDLLETPPLELVNAPKPKRRRRSKPLVEILAGFVNIALDSAS